jgi:hypothetical protein
LEHGESPAATDRATAPDDLPTRKRLTFVIAKTPTVRKLRQVGTFKKAADHAAAAIVTPAPD